MHNCDCTKCKCPEILEDMIAYCQECNDTHMVVDFYCKCDIPNVGQYLPFEERPPMAMYCGSCGGKLKGII